MFNGSGKIIADVEQSRKGKNNIKNTIDKF
jgi:hypothetical protein